MIKGRSAEEILKINLSNPLGLLSGMRHLSNRITKVFICIRLKPKKQDPEEAEKELEDNIIRAMITARYAVLNGYDPEIMFHLSYWFLSDVSQTEWDLERKICQVRLTNCNLLWSILDEGESPSAEMVSDMEIAEENGVPVEHKDFSEIEAWVKDYDKTP